MDARIDLHTHSNCSDGVLSPEALVQLAATRQLQLLALTDHDTVAGCAAAQSACDAHGIRFVPGIELTAEWREREIHIVGLAVDVTSPVLHRQIGALGELRRERIRAIGERLDRHGLPGSELATQALAAASPTRMHMARLLVGIGACADTEQAFEDLLKRGRPGHVPARWPQLADTVACLHEAGGIAVLAHPHRYKLSNGQLRELCAQFRLAGGGGIEVSLSGMSPADAERTASLARRFDLAGSIGSDFHEPGLPWRPLGRFAKLPDGVTPITGQLMQRMS